MVCVPSMSANSNRSPATALIINHTKAAVNDQMIRCMKALISGSIFKEQLGGRLVRFDLFLYTMFKSTVFDSLHFISTLTFRKLANGILVWLSYQLSRFTGRLIHWGAPLSLSIEPTTACNLGCPECPSGLRSFTRSTGSMKIDLAKQIIYAQRKQLMYLGFYFQGEPYLNKDLIEMIAYASSLNIYTGTSTNGHFLTDELAKRTVESGLSRLIISVDGPTAASYATYRKGGDFNEVVEGIQRIMAWKKKLKRRTPYVVIQCVVFRHNEHELDEMRKLALQLHVDALWFKSAQVYDYQNDPHGLIPEKEQYRRYTMHQEGIRPLNADHTHCWRMWHGNVVTWDGKVVPCCFDKDAQHQLGDVRDMSMQEIWQGHPYRSFRKQLMKSRKNVNICANCSEGLCVRLEKS